MRNDNLNELKNEYMGIDIPDNLDSVVKESIKNNKTVKSKKIIFKRRFVIGFVSVLSLLLFINISPSFANTISKVPVLAYLVKLVTIEEYTIDKNNIEVKIEVPKLQGLEDKKIEERLNEEFLNEGRELYKQLEKEVNLKNSSKKYVSTDYSIKSENEDMVSIEMQKLEVQASSNTTRKHYNIDKNRNIVLTLPMLFKSDKYINIISENIKTQMRKEMKEDKNKKYFIGKEDKDIDGFDKIDKNQDFYIDNKGQLVICFNQFDVAPGYMGVVEFTIPSNILNSL